jgi:hypothetical protein
VRGCARSLAPGSPKPARPQQGSTPLSIPCSAPRPSRVERAAADVAGVAADLTQVCDAAELPLPLPPWQRAEPGDPALFASLVDFLPGLDDARRAGIEAACEAVGLLAASVHADGAVVAGSGELLVATGPPVSPNLASPLAPAVPEDAGIDTTTVAQVLTSIGMGAGSAASLWVADDGLLVSGTTLALTMAMAGRGIYCADLTGPGMPTLERRRCLSA